MIEEFMKKIREKYSDESLEEKKKKKKDDRCTRIAKRKYKAWPSAYASGAVVRCRAGKIWKDLSEDMTDEQLAENQEYEQIEEIDVKKRMRDLRRKSVAGMDAPEAPFFPDGSISHDPEYEMMRRRYPQLTPFEIRILIDGTPGQKQGVRNKLKRLEFEKTTDIPKADQDGTPADHKSRLKKKKPSGGGRTSPDAPMSVPEGHMDDKPYRSDKDAKVKVKDIVEDLRKWFGRKGAPGKTGGWVDCNTCRKDPKTGKKKCKACGRKKGGAGGGSRKKYPRCRPTPAACKGYKRRGSNLKKEQKIEEIEYNYIPAHEATYDDGNPIDFMLEFWDDVVVEAEYQGRKVKLNKPMRGDVKKFKVYVKDPKTKNVKKVNFGDPNMRIKKSNPKRRKSFRARHNCDNPGPKTKARYWSCRKW